MSASYQRIPTASPPPATPPPATPPPATTSSSQHRPQATSTRAAFNEPPPPAWKRIALVLAVIAMFWLSIKLGGMGGKKKPEIIYASRYSDEHKYRPAASPIITETLSSGRIRIRGANPAGVGIRPGDLPKTPQELARERKEREERALEEAKKQLGLKKRKRKKKVPGGTDEI